MNQRLKVYLKQTVKEIRNSAKRRNAYIELRSHVLDILEEKKSRGLSEEVSIDEILSSLPKPKKFARSLQRASRPWYWRYPLITLSFASTMAAIGLVVLSSHLLVTRYLQPKLFQQLSLDERVAKVTLRDFEEIESLNIFPEVSGSKNAASFLYHHIGGDRPKPSLRDDVELAEEIGQLYANSVPYNPILPRLLKRTDIQAVDVSWFESLWEYDHIDFAELPEAQEIARRAGRSNSMAKIDAAMRMPYINLFPLRGFFIIYVLQKYREGKVELALSQSRKLANLIYSNGLLGDQLVAVTVLSDVMTLAEQFEVSAPHDFSHDQLTTHYLTLRVWPFIVMRSYHEGEISAGFERYARKGLGLCAGVNEHYMGFQGMRDFLAPKKPFEIDFHARIEKAKFLAEDLLRRCGRYELYRHFLEDTPVGENKLWDQNHIEVWEMVGLGKLFKYLPTQYLPNLSRIPYLRRILIYQLMNWFVPNIYPDYYYAKAQERDGDEN